MLSVILTILKIIGIILLVILGLLLTAVLIVLFVPVRYKSMGSFAKTDDGFKDKILIRATWLFHILSVTFNLDDTEPKLSIKILGKELSLGTNNNEKDARNKKRHKSVSRDEKQDGKAADDITVQNVSIEVDKSLDDSKAEQSAKITDETVVERNVAEQSKKDTVENIPEKKAKASLKEKIKNIWNKIDLICEKIKNIKDVKDSFVHYLKRDDSKLAIKEIKHIILKVLKHILPKKLWARVKFGFEDPATTGNILGVASILYGVYGDHLELEPDFEHVVLEGEYKLNGRIRAFTLLVAAFKIYRNKWLKEFIAFSKKKITQF